MEFCDKTLKNNRNFVIFSPIETNIYLCYV